MKVMTDHLATISGRLGRHPPLALRNVIHGRTRSLAAIGGISFALVMMLLQLGLPRGRPVHLGGQLRPARFRRLAVVSSGFEQFYEPGLLPPPRGWRRPRGRRGRRGPAALRADELVALPGLPAGRSRGRDAIGRRALRTEPLVAREPRPTGRFSGVRCWWSASTSTGTRSASRSAARSRRPSAGSGCRGGSCSTPGRTPTSAGTSATRSGLGAGRRRRSRSSAGSPSCGASGPTPRCSAATRTFARSFGRPDLGQTVNFGLVDGPPRRRRPRPSAGSTSGSPATSRR